MAIIETDGKPHLKGHRITVHHIVRAWVDEDRSVEEIATEVYPHLTETQVVEALRYALEHRAELDELEEKQGQIEDEIRKEAISSPEDLPTELRKELPS